MRTPILDFVRAYADASAVRMHMPGHKGVGDFERLDITELMGADDLFHPSGIIKESEDNLSEIFGADSFYSTEGSSLSIRAAIYLVSTYLKSVGKKPTIIAGRNAHKSFVSALALVDMDVVWHTGSDSYLTVNVDTSYLEEELVSSGAGAVYITSPDYLGNISDIRAISEVCHKHGALLVVDNAHGAYLKFLQNSRHPIDLGADIVVDSAHKTLPVLTGGGYIHIRRGTPCYFKSHLKSAMSLFASTSPSYIILESLDGVNPYLAGDFGRDLQTIVDKITELKQKITALGYKLVGDEDMKITILAKPYGYTGDSLADLLSRDGIYVEFADSDYVVFMPSVATTDTDLSRLFEALSKIERREPIMTSQPSPVLPRSEMSVREAMMSPSVVLPLDECQGRVLAECSVACPPAVPIVVSGEVIDEECIKILRYYGTESLAVVKKI